MMDSAMSNAPASLGQIVLDAAGIFRPPERLTVAEAAVKYVRVHAPPRYSGPYKPDETPYMVEPQNMVMSREHTPVVFCGPSQTGSAGSSLQSWKFPKIGGIGL